MIASGGDLEWRDAQRAAAKEVAAQERELKRNIPLQAPQPNPGEVTPGNARKWLYDRLAEIAVRLKVHIVDDEPAPQFKKHVQAPECSGGRTERPPDPGNFKPSLELKPPAPSDPGNLSIVDKLEPEPEPIIGGFASTTPTSERIDDREYHTSVQSPVTQTWRRSIELPQKRGLRWIG
jgi:hypothetical protein